MAALPQATTDEFAAHVALIALRAGMPNRELTDGQRYIIDPDTVAVTRDDAVMILAARPKPLRCEAQAAGGALRIRCRQILDPVLLDVQTRGAEEGVELFGEGIHVPGDSADDSGQDALVLVRGYQERRLVPWKAMERWFRDYRIVPYAMATRDPDPAARREGARTVFEFDQGEFYPLNWPQNDHH